jgi:hypothetical protein
LGAIASGLSVLALGCVQANIGDSTPDGGDPPSDAGATADASADAGPVERTLSHSSSRQIVAANSVSCNGGSPNFFHTANSYYRVYDLAALGVIGDFEVSRVAVGIEEAVGSGGSQPATVMLYRLTGNLRVDEFGPPLASVDVTIADQMLTVLDVPVTASVPAGSSLVVELFTPNGQGASERFFIGSNTEPESAPSYLRAPDCAVNSVPIAEPTTTAGIGFPGMHIVLDVTGIVR